VSQAMRALLNSGTPKSEIAVLVSKQPHLYAAPLMASLAVLRHTLPKFPEVDLRLDSGR
jgi:hypothetical protein